MTEPVMDMTALVPILVAFGIFFGAGALMAFLAALTRTLAGDE